MGAMCSLLTASKYPPLRSSNSSKLINLKALGFHAPLHIFWAAFLIRVLYMTLAHTYRFSSLEDHFHFGWEMGRIARALTNGRGYSDPFVGQTGPTAWVPPLYPLLMAGVFKFFGIYSAMSAWVLLTINSFFSAITALATYEIAARCYNDRVAVWSSWAWALHPAAMQYAVRWIWDTSLTTGLFATVLVLTLRMRGIGNSANSGRPDQSFRQWISFGFLWGLIGLSNSTILLFFPINVVWIIHEKPKTAAMLRNAAVGGLIFVACIGLWTFRNWEAFGSFVPMRSNLGVEMWAWNNPDANGIALGAPIEPVERDPRYVLYAKMGEIAYSRHQGELAKAYIQKNPGHFFLLSLKRFYFYWASDPHPVDNKPLIEGTREVSYCFLSLTGLMGLGLSLKNRIPASDLFAWSFLLLPLTYYFVNIQARFRHPLEPLIAICSVYLFQSATLSGKIFCKRGPRNPDAVSAS
jgi:4-amino-4-deoxy-L-arabinose transferase-like glycosyltransferase